MMGATLSNMGRNPLTGESAFSIRHVKDILSIMFTCGMYDYSGQWAYRVGVPAKSGVSGGVLAVVNRQVGIATYSPRLDPCGNSCRGIEVCCRPGVAPRPARLRLPERRVDVPRRGACGKPGFLTLAGAVGAQLGSSAEASPYSALICLPAYPASAITPAPAAAGARAPTWPGPAG